MAFSFCLLIPTSLSPARWRMASSVVSETAVLTSEVRLSCFLFSSCLCPGVSTICGYSVWSLSDSLQMFCVWSRAVGEMAAKHCWVDTVVFSCLYVSYWTNCFVPPSKERRTKRINKCTVCLWGEGSQCFLLLAVWAGLVRQVIFQTRWFNSIFTVFFNCLIPKAFMILKS